MAGLINLDLGSILNNAKGIFEGVGSLAKDIRTAITGKVPLDPTKLAELEMKALELEQMSMNAQTEINKIEAASPSLFVAGWRPFIGWICGLGLFYHFIGYSLVMWVVFIAKLNITPPVLDTEGLLSIVLSLLGLGAYRTFEKVKSAQSNH